MTGEYSFLENLKEILDNFVDEEPRLAEYLKKSYDKIDSELRKKIIDLKTFRYARIVIVII